MRLVSLWLSLLAHDHGFRIQISAPPGLISGLGYWALRGGAFEKSRPHTPAKPFKQWFGGLSLCLLAF